MREQVIQTILAVARRFPIIRFDAAMVLARRHIRRLWWPEPGSAGGAIPSRAEHALDQAAFDAALPNEFWREVVDRVAAEGLDTLLLAEAFWMLEGYFVRTLGMHRVYNSAFMNMLRDERNAEYRQVMKNTLEFDPEILKRYVNFMNNPDESAAVEQFGKGDKYFGIATLLTTLPGLPMFGHGQVEGFSERYGMEYRRAYMDESIDERLVRRHETEIFPLARRRAQFAAVQDFLLYDFVTDDGGVNEDVFAYSNGKGASRSLVLYHNRYASTSGVVRQSVSYSVPDGAGGRVLIQRSLAEGLDLPVETDGRFVMFRESTSGLEYLRSVRELRERGLWVHLDAYGRQVFVDFTDVQDGPSGGWRQLEQQLGGRGVPSLNAAYRDMVLAPVHSGFAQVVNADVARALADTGVRNGQGAEPLVERIVGDVADVAAKAGELVDGGPRPPSSTALSEGLSALITPQTADDDGHAAIKHHPVILGAALAAVTAGCLPNSRDLTRQLDDWDLGSTVAEMFKEIGGGDPEAWRRVDAVRAMIALPRWTLGSAPVRDQARATVDAWLANNAARRAIGINLWQDVLWFRGEAYSEFVDQAAALEWFRAAPELRTGKERVEKWLELSALVAELRRLAANSGYRVEALAESTADQQDVAGVAPGARPNDHQ